MKFSSTILTGDNKEEVQENFVPQAKLAVADLRWHE
jgi:hypothetical protein